MSIWRSILGKGRSDAGAQTAGGCCRRPWCSCSPAISALPLNTFSQGKEGSYLDELAEDVDPVPSSAVATNVWGQSGPA